LPPFHEFLHAGRTPNCSDIRGEGKAAVFGRSSPKLPTKNSIADPRTGRQGEAWSVARNTDLTGMP
jgi:hypothetical protein